MVTTRSQAANLCQPAETNAPPPRRSTRIASKKPVSTRKGKEKAAAPPPTPNTQNHHLPRPKSRHVTPLPDGDDGQQRSWPSTPNAPRKPPPTQSFPRQASKPNFAASSSLSDGEMMTPTPTPNLNVGNQNRMLIRDETPLLGSPSRHRHQQYLSPNDICNSIPGEWTRAPNTCSRRLVIIPDDVSTQAQYEREAGMQKTYDQIFREHYAVLMEGKERSDREVGEMLARQRMDHD